MPRTVEEILQHADELATRFEDGDEASGVGHDPHSVGLRVAVAARGEAERHLIEAVTAARTSGMSWAAIGQFVGTTGEAARQRYAAKLA
ncbi:MAG: hypothetical protein KGP12_09290 [Actinomycetales bacterium]|nr:hypothetical protein [Actinomycetales bacterium]